MQRLNALKKFLQRHETEKKIRAAKILFPPLPGFLMVRPLGTDFLAGKHFHISVSRRFSTNKRQILLLVIHLDRPWWFWHKATFWHFKSTIYRFISRLRSSLLQFAKCRFRDLPNSDEAIADWADLRKLLGGGGEAHPPLATALFMASYGRPKGTKL